jgi:hypothetical protein
MKMFGARRRKNQGTGGGCIVRGFVACSPHKIIFLVMKSMLVGEKCIQALDEETQRKKTF